MKEKILKILKNKKIIIPAIAIVACLCITIPTFKAAADVVQEREAKEAQKPKLVFIDEFNAKLKNTEFNEGDVLTLDDVECLIKLSNGTTKVPTEYLSLNVDGQPLPAGEVAIKITYIDSAPSNPDISLIDETISPNEKRVYGDAKFDVEFTINVTPKPQPVVQQEVQEPQPQPQPVYSGVSYKVQGVPFINQNAQGLPAGCEGTSLTMALNYIGIPVSAWDTCMGFMPRTVNDSADIYNVFIGDPSVGGHGYGCYQGCVITTARSILNYYGSGAEICDLTGNLDSVYEHIRANVPVVIWGTVGWGYPNYGIYSNAAGSFEWWSNQHCLLLTGYDDNNVIINDPYIGEVVINRATFESVWTACGSRAVAVH